jgi:hypothetical protein
VHPRQACGQTRGGADVGPINYDPKDDVVIVAVGGRSPQYPVVLRHMVWHPTEVDTGTDDLPQSTVRVVEADGTTTLVIFYSDEA